jgi:hypothetical protein
VQGRIACISVDLGLHSPGTIGLLHQTKIEFIVIIIVIIIIIIIVRLFSQRDIEYWVGELVLRAALGAAALGRCYGAMRHCQHLSLFLEFSLPRSH